MGNYDRKKSTPCTDCMRCLKWIPVIFIVAIIVWSYYAYVVQLCLLSIDSTVQKIIFIALYHIVCVLFFWSYWNTIFTPVGTVPHKWRIPESEIDRLFRAENQEQQKRVLENFAKDLPVSNRTLHGAVRFCEKCQIIKPDRAHHCSVCGTCVLKMDHHCPWVNNCVNFKNYKFFVLFLGYALLYCLYVALTSLEYFIKFWRVSTGELNGGMGRFHILFLFFVSLMFAISLVSLFGYHIYLVLVNRTTLEAFRAPVFRIGGPDKNGFNLGKYANFQEVFGDNWKLWLIPVYTSLGDGLIYPTQGHHQSSSYESMGDTQTRLDQPTDTFLNQPIDNLPSLNNAYGNANANASLSSTNAANIANGNVIIDMKSSNYSDHTDSHIFVVNGFDDASSELNKNQLTNLVDEKSEPTKMAAAPVTVMAMTPAAAVADEQNCASIINI
ncbi:palmitoyltransferase ZDHHC20-B isoform X1 [Episyrphus balteatus]|uniref:palmitoyltransferase ZDHHC20-B isoform X1 n=1 Tax=Episyrphus balteatus TaxID=286459 RepID=UPI002486A4C6|nr:palmitoyltransferase ZDHHC20-B isoform X1 [Episyrphus balteatus]